MRSYVFLYVVMSLVESVIYVLIRTHASAHTHTHTHKQTQTHTYTHYTNTQKYVQALTHTQTYNMYTYLAFVVLGPVAEPCVLVERQTIGTLDVVGVAQGAYVEGPGIEEWCAF